MFSYLRLSLALIILSGFCGWAEAHPNSSSKLIIKELQALEKIQYQMTFYIVDHDLFTALRPEMKSRKSFLLKEWEELRESLISYAQNSLRTIPEEICTGSPPKGIWKKKLIKITWRLECKEKLKGIDLRLPLVMEAVHTSHVALIIGKVKQEFLSSPYQTKLQFQKEGARPSKAYSSFVLLGMEHILFGLDHLLYVFLIVICSRKALMLLKQLSFFTLGHSATLIAGYFFPDLVPVPLVEGLIAISIVYMAFRAMKIEEKGPENISLFLFGLFHGLGFSYAISQISTDGIIWKLLLFNLGVEIGQALAAAPFFILLLNLIRLESFKKIKITFCAISGAFALYLAFDRLKELF